MGRFLAYGSSAPPPGLGGKGFFGNVIKSAGDTWTQITNAVFSAASQPVALSFVNSRFIITTTGTSVISSADTVTWTQHFVSGFVPGSGLAFGAGVYVIAIADLSFANPRIFSSPDLVTWTSHVSNLTGVAGIPPFDPVFGNGVFVVVSKSNNGYATSVDGATWTLRNTYAPNAWGQPIFDGTQFVACVLSASGNPKIATSTDGINWTESTLTLSAAFSSGNAPFVVGHKGLTQYLAGNLGSDAGESADGTFTLGVTFSYNNTGFGTPVGPAYSGSSWARINASALGGAALRSSTDGLSWTPDTIPAGFAKCVGLQFGLGVFIAVGLDNSSNLFVITRGP